MTGQMTKLEALNAIILDKLGGTRRADSMLEAINMVVAAYGGKGDKINMADALEELYTVYDKGGQVDPYTGPTEITPSFVEQVLEIAGKTPAKNITVKAIAPVKMPDEITLSGDGYINTKDDVKAVYATVGEVGWYKTGSTHPVEVAIADSEKAKLTAENIRKDVTILGVTGTLEAGETDPYTGAMTVTPSTTEQTLPTDGKTVTGDIKVEAIEEEKSQDGISLRLTSPPWEPSETFTISEKGERKILSPYVRIAGYYSVHWGTAIHDIGIAIDDSEQAKIIPENIKKDVSILGVTGTLETGETDPYTGPTEITPSSVDQVLETAGKTPTENITVKAIASGSSQGIEIKKVSKTDPDAPSYWGGYAIDTVAGEIDLVPTVVSGGNYSTAWAPEAGVCAYIALEEQAKIIPENIKKDVSILGVTGTLETTEKVYTATFTDTFTDITTGLKTLDLTGVTLNDGVSFEGMSNLESLNLTDCNADAISDMSSMFKGCTSLKTLRFPYLGIGKKTSITLLDLSDCPLDFTTYDEFNLFNGLASRKGATGATLRLKKTSWDTLSSAGQTGAWLSLMDKNWTIEQVE